MKYINFLLLLVVFCSCNKTTYINPSKDTLVYPIQGGEMLDTIHSDGEWEVTIFPDWVNVERQDCVLKCVVEENTLGKKREGKIVLKGGDVRKSISISQAYVCTHINPENTTLTFEKEGGVQSISIDTDGFDIKVEVSGNMTAKYDEGKLVVEAPANNAMTTTGKIELACDSQTALVNVVLRGATCPNCGGKGKVTCTKCSGEGYYWMENDDMTYGCTLCGGRGCGYFQELSEPGGDLRKGTGLMKCPVCNGKGS